MNKITHQSTLILQIYGSAGGEENVSNDKGDVQSLPAQEMPVLGREIRKLEGDYDLTGSEHIKGEITEFLTYRGRDAFKTSRQGWKRECEV